MAMPNPESPTGEMAVRRGCTAMHPTDSRGGGLIPGFDGTDTSKLPYTCVCNQPRCLGIRGGFGAYSADLRCTLHNTPPYTPEVVG